MDGARRAAFAALVLVFVLAAAAGAPRTPVRPALAAAVAWPVATLVVSEVVTGGASASDEFIELENAGPSSVDLAGLEVAYVTSSGSTVTRKATWAAATLLAPGRHLLIANAAGAYASTADTTYSGGLAATGGAVVLRPVGGTPIDAFGWGDAASAFVEGASAPAPAASSSIERRPGGAAGNGVDTNDNAADWFVQVLPSPQNRSAAAVPVASASPVPSSPAASPSVAIPSPTAATSASVAPSVVPPSPTATTEATATTPPGSPSASAVTGTPSPSTTPDPTAPPSPSSPPPATPAPSVGATPSPDPTPTRVPPTPSPSPSVAPSPSAAPTPTGIGAVRGLVDGSTATIAGTLTTALGAVESGHGGFVQDSTGGIALYVDTPLASGPPAGTTVEATGVVDDRYGQRTLRVAAADILVTGVADLPAPLRIAAGGASEPTEGLRLTVTGSTVGSPSSLADGIGLIVDDGTGQLRAVVSPAALGGLSIPAGTSVTVTGPLGQRDSSGTGLAGYRVFVMEPGDLVVSAALPSPSPSPSESAAPAPSASALPSATPGATATPSSSPRPTSSPSPAASATPAPTASPTPAATPTPTATPTPSAAAMTIADARLRPIGSNVTVAGVVTAEAGRLGVPGVVAVEDETGAIAIRAADAVILVRGTRIEVTGTLADPYGQLEIRSKAAARIVGLETVPEPVSVTGIAVGEATEAWLVSLSGTIESNVRKGSGGDLGFDLRTANGVIRVAIDASSRLTTADFEQHASYRLTGIVGQRATKKGRLDGYRLWLRDRSDVELIAPDPTPSPSPSRSPSPSPSPHPTPKPSPHPTPITMPVAQAAVTKDRLVSIEAIVTAETSLLDASGRRLVVEDASGAIEVYLPVGAIPARVGTRIAVDGTVVRAYGAPRLKATAIRPLGGGSPRSPLELRGAPGPGHEWRLVRATGTVADVHRLGDRWRAELVVGSDRIPVSGLTGAHIPVDSLVEGRRATVTGIVRRPYPNAADRRFAIVPRGSFDIALGGPVTAASTAGSGGGGPARGASGPATTAAATLDVDLRALAASVGRTVRVGGLVVEQTSDGATIDDGTAVGRIVLAGPAADLIPLLEPGDAVNATGRVERRGKDVVVAVSDPAGLARIGDATATPEPSAEPSAGPSAATRREASVAGTRDAGRLGMPGTAGIASLVLVSAASAAVTLLRRRRTRRRLFAAVAARLSSVSGTTSPAATQMPEPTPDGTP